MTEEQLGWLLGIILPTTAIGVAALIYIKCRERKKSAANAAYTIDTVTVIPQ